MNKLTNASFSQLVVQYERLVYTVCFQLVRDAAAAEDLTQEEVDKRGRNGYAEREI